jgi:hypothetical protein
LSSVNCDAPDIVREILGVSSQRALFTENLVSRHTSSKECNPRLCDDIPEFKRKHKRTCQVCHYEGCGRSLKSVSYCYKHSVRTCTLVQPDIKDRKAFQIGAKIAVMHSDADISKWLCTNPDLTCWEKMHQFYLPRNVFAKSTSAKSTSNSKDHPLLHLNCRSTMYKARKLFCDESTTMSGEAEMLQSESDGDMCQSGCFSPRAPAQRPVAQGRMHRSGIVSSPNSNDPVVETESEGDVCVSGGSSTSLCSSNQTTPTQHSVGEGRKLRSGIVSMPNTNCHL